MASNLEQSSSKMSEASATKEEVADSWEDEALSDSAPEDDQKQEQQAKMPSEDTDRPPRTALPKAPPPTPVSPRTNTPDWGSQGSTDFRDERRRPAKSTAVAGRLIAGALGVKAPKKTEEQRAYLAKLGCHSFQGYLFSHPLPLGQFNEN